MTLLETILLEKPYQARTGTPLSEFTVSTSMCTRRSGAPWMACFWVGVYRHQFSNSSPGTQVSWCLWLLWEIKQLAHNLKTPVALMKGQRLELWIWMLVFGRMVQSYGCIAWITGMDLTNLAYRKRGSLGTSHWTMVVLFACSIASP